MPGVRPRSVLVDTGLGLALAWLGWVAATFDRDQPRLNRRGPGEDSDRRDLFTPATTPELIPPALLLLVAAVAVRRVWPRAAFVGVVVALGGYLAAGGALGPVFAGLAITVHAMATAVPARRWVPLTALLVPMVLAGHWQQSDLGLLDPSLYAELLMVLAIAVLPAMFALLRRTRRENAEREREQDRRRYADEERLRIAREVHDVVGHSLSVITLQAGVALHVLERRPAQAAESLEAIRRTSKDALAELRTTLEVFRDPDGSAPHGLRPGLARLDDLVGALTGAGREVRLERVDVAPETLPVAVDQAAFRIVQEALTNVVRHAGPATATVRLVQQPGRLTLAVTDDGTATQVPTEGNGISGMRERAAAVGGSVEVAVAEPRGLAVRSVLPWVAES